MLEYLPLLQNLARMDFAALSRQLATLQRENLVLRMSRLERTLRELNKIYSVYDLLNKFKTEQRLLPE